jgi:hypothetical protein
MSLLWVSIEPMEDETRLLVTEGTVGAALRARLPPVPRQPRSLATLLEGLSGWYGQPITAVVAADARDVESQPTRWTQLLREVDGDQVRVEWVVAPPPATRDRFLDDVGGDFRGAQRLIRFAATGQR